MKKRNMNMTLSQFSDFPGRCFFHEANVKNTSVFALVTGWGFFFNDLGEGMGGYVTYNIYITVTAQILGYGEHFISSVIFFRRHGPPWYNFNLCTSYEVVL